MRTPTAGQLRRALTKELVASHRVSAPAVRRAFEVVPRELFVPEVARSRGLAAVYANEALVTKTDGSGQAISSSSQPSIMAPMLEHLALERGQRVLEIGAGTGYNAALIKSIVGPDGRVTTVDIDTDTVRRARAALKRGGFPAKVLLGDGAKGWRGGAPYDRIIVTASSAEIPRAWFTQLKPGGLLQLPLRLSADTFGPQIVVTFVKERDRLRSVRLVPGGFMTMRNRDGADATDWDRMAMQIRVGGKNRVMGLSGQALGRLTEGARQRLFGLMVGRPRRKVVYRGPGIRVGGGALFVAIGAGSRYRLDAAGWWASALLDAAGSGLAVVAPRGDTYTPGAKASLHAACWGSSKVEQQLDRLIAGWRARGRPTWEDLRITATFGRAGTRGWRSRRQGVTHLSFDWASRLP